MIPLAGPAGCQQHRQPAWRGRYRELREVPATGQAIRVFQALRHGKRNGVVVRGGPDLLPRGASPALTMAAEEVADQDRVAREKVYAAERSLPAAFRLQTVSDDQAGTLMSQHLGRPGYIVRLDDNPGYLFGFWRLYPGYGRIPVIVAPRCYPLRQYEVAHEIAHLITDRDGPHLGHGTQFIQTYLRVLRRHTSLREALQERFDAHGLTTGTAAGGRDCLRLLRLARDAGIVGTPLSRAGARCRKAAARIFAGIGDVAAGPVPRARPGRGYQPAPACLRGPMAIRGPRAGRNCELPEVPATDQAIRASAGPGT